MKNIHLITSGLSLDQALQGFNKEILYAEEQELVLNLLTQYQAVRAKWIEITLN